MTRSLPRMVFEALALGMLSGPMVALGAAAADGPSRVIVGLRLPWRQEGLLAPAAQEDQRFAIGIAQEQLLDELRGTDSTLIHNFTSIPFQALEVTPAALDLLRSSSLVSSIEPDRVLKPTLAESVPLIQGDQAWAAGYDGTGTAVAVVDTGVEASHSFFGGRVVTEACFSTNTTNVVSLCPNGQTTQIGAGAASPAACSGISGCDHGTHVAGIAAGSGASFSGVAKGAAIIGVQVFSKFTSSADCGGAAPCVSAFFTDVIRGLEHVLTLKDTYQIASVNMSLGGGKYTSDAACDAANAAVKAAIDNLRSVGIASVISSGNDGFTDGIGTPGCVSTAIAVGSTTKQDAISSFSNSSPMVELLAPGEAINSSITGNGFGLKSGTSMAAPHVTGAWAILKQQSPSATVPQILTALSASGLSITDARNGVTKPRIRIKNALSPSLHVNDVSVGEGNSGTVDATFTVTLSPPAAGTVTVQYQTANGTATSGIDYVAASGTLTFLAGDAAKLVTVAVNGDVVEEADETFFVNLSGVTGGVSIVDGQGLGTIRNDDAPSCSVVVPGVVDGTFEAGAPWPAWTTQSSTSFGTPLCDTGCGNGGGTAPPYAGNNWVWFGGATAAETGILGQSLALPVSTDLRLRFQMRIGAVAAPADDTFVVALDGTPIRTFTEPAIAEAAYFEREVNLTPFADGGVHALRFTYTHPDTGSGNLTVDNVQIVSCQGAGLPALSIGDVAVPEGNTGTSTATFTVSLSAASGQAVTVNYTTANGSATAGSDYVTASGTLTFPPGPTMQTLSVTVNGDAAIEPNETFFVNLSGATNATIADAQGVGTINDDDSSPAPTLSINDVTVTEGNSGAKTVTFTISLSVPSAQSVSVSYATASGTATPDPMWAGTTAQGKSVAFAVVNGGTEVFPISFEATLPCYTLRAIYHERFPISSNTFSKPAPPAPACNDKWFAGTFTSPTTVSGTFSVAVPPAFPPCPCTYGLDTTWNAAPTGPMTPGDYGPTWGSAFISPGATSTVITVLVEGDTAIEANETFFVNLSGATNATIADTQGVGTITNDDVPVPTLSINDVAVTEGNSGTTSATFTVSLSVASGQTVTVNYATANGSATAGSDYVAASGTLTFPPGSPTQSLSVTVNGDAAIEPNETFLVNLSGATNATIADAQGVGTINNDDLPALSVNDVAVNEGNSGTTSATFMVSLSAASGLAVMVNYATANGSATAGSDYVAASGTLTFPPGSTTQSLPVTVNGDTAIEPNETFLVNLSGATNAFIPDPQGVGTINNDDGSPATSFFTLTPCRVVDTRDPDGALGGPALQPGAQRTFALAGPKCAIPATATAVSINITVTGATTQGNVRLFPPGVAVPLVSTINFIAGQTRANNAIVQVGDAPTGSVVVLNGAAGTVHFILDVNGYFE